MEASRENPSATNTMWLLPVRLFPGVCPQMSCEICRSGEDLATVPGAEGSEVGETLAWSTLPLSRFLFIQSPAQGPSSYLWVGLVIPPSLPQSGGHSGCDQQESLGAHTPPHATTKLRATLALGSLSFPVLWLSAELSSGLC